MEIKTTFEQIEEVMNLLQKEENNLGQYARKEIPMRDLFTELKNNPNKKKWIPVSEFKAIIHDLEDRLLARKDREPALRLIKSIRKSI